MDPTIITKYRKFIRDLVDLPFPIVKPNTSTNLITAIENDDVDMNQVTALLTQDTFDDFSIKTKERKEMSKRIEAFAKECDELQKKHEELKKKYIDSFGESAYEELMTQKDSDTKSVDTKPNEVAQSTKVEQVLKNLNDICDDSFDNDYDEFRQDLAQDRFFMWMKKIGAIDKCEDMHMFCEMLLCFYNIPTSDGPKHIQCDVQTMKFSYFEDVKVENAFNTFKRSLSDVESSIVFGVLQKHFKDKANVSMTITDDKHLMFMKHVGKTIDMNIIERLPMSKEKNGTYWYDWVPWMSNVKLIVPSLRLDKVK